MSKTIDQKIVEMRFDNKDFESNVKNSISSLDKLKSNLNMDSAVKGLDNLNHAVRGTTLSGLSNAVETVRTKFSALEIMAITALANITNSAINAGKRMVSALTVAPIKDGFQEYEMVLGAIQTTMAGTGKTMEEVEQQLKRLDDYADETIYSTKDMLSNLPKFTNAGVELEIATTAMIGIANATALAGGDARSASSAFYNLGQSIGTGYLTRMDYNSINNAGIATMEWKNQMVDAAIAQGQLIKVGEDAYEANGKSFTLQSLFIDGLQQQWATADVLIKVFEDYGDVTTDIGKKAQSSAQDIKTFTMMMESLQAAAGTGWKDTWQLLFGNLEDAKVLWTGLGNAIGDIISKSAKARNVMLSEWTALGGRTSLMDAFTNALKGAYNAVVIVKDAFHDIFPEITAERLYNFTEKLKRLSERMILSEEATDRFRRAFRGVFAIFGIATQAISAIIKGILSFGKEFKFVADGTTSISAAFGDWLVKLNETIKRTDIFNKVVGKIVDVLKTAISFIVQLIKKGKELGIFNTIFNWIKVGVSAVGVILSKAFSVLKNIRFEDISSGLKEAASHVTSLFDKFKDKFPYVSNGFKTITSSISKFYNKIKEKFDLSGMTILQGALEILKGLMGLVVGASIMMKDAIVSAISAIGKAVSSSKFFIFLEAVWNLIKVIGKAIFQIFGKAISFLTEQMSGFDSEKFLNIVSGLSIGGIAVALIDFIRRLKSPFKEFGDIMEGMVDILDSLRGCLEAYQAKLRAEALMKIAISMAILTAAIFVLSTIDPEKLTDAISALTILFIELMAGMAIVSKMSAKISGLIKTTTAMVALSLAVLVLAFALRTISKIDSNKLVESLMGVAGLMGIVVGAAKILNSNGGTVIKGATQMLIFALALKVLASVCKDLSTLSWEELGRGLAGVAGLMAEVVIFLNTVKFQSKAISTALGMILIAAAIKILASACAYFSKFSWEEIAKGLTAVGALLLEFSVFSKLISKSKHMISAGISLILIAAGMKILASACKDFAQLSWEEIGKGLTSVGVLLLEIAAFVNLAGSASKLITTGIALIAISAAIKILASAMIDLSTLSWDGIARGLTVIAGSLLAITVALNFMPKNMVGIGVGLLAVSAAILILSSALIKMAELSWEEVAKGLIVFGGALALLAIGLHAMTGTIAGAAALMIASIAMMLLAPALAIFASMSWKGIAKGLVILAGAFTVMGVAGLVLAPLIPVILGLSAALALVGISVLAMGAGFILAGAGLTAISLGLVAIAGAFASSGTVIVGALDQIARMAIALIPYALAKLGEGIIELCNVLIAGIPVFGKAIDTLIKETLRILTENVPPIVDVILDLLTQILQKIAEHTPEIIQAALDIFFGILQGLADNIQRIVETAIDIVVNFIEGIASKLPDVIQAGVDLLLGFIEGLTQAIDKNTDRLIDAITDLMASLIEAAVKVLFGGTDLFVKVGERLMDSGLISGIKDKVGNLLSTVSDFIRKAKDKISEKINEWKSVGKDVINGFIQGIKDAASKAWDTIKNVATSIKDAFCKILGINSPSTVFSEYGKNINEGLVVGLNKYSNKVEKASKEVGNSAIHGMSKTFSKLSDLVGDTLDTTPTIRPVLDLTDVQNGSARLRNIMGGYDGYAISGTVSKAEQTYASFASRGSLKNANDSAGVEGKFKAVLDKITTNNQPPINNTFNISGSNSKDIADEIARRLQKQLERRESSWA